MMPAHNRPLDRVREGQASKVWKARLHGFDGGLWHKIVGSLGKEVATGTWLAGSINGSQRALEEEIVNQWARVLLVPIGGIANQTIYHYI